MPDLLAKDMSDLDLGRVDHPLAVGEGSTENTTQVKNLLVGLRERG